MDYIIANKHLAWDDQEGMPGRALKKRSDLNFMDELYAALSGGVSNVETAVAGSGEAIGDVRVRNVPLKAGYLETDLSIPILVGETPTEQHYAAAAQEMPVRRVRQLNWLLIVVIALVVIIFLRGLFLSDANNAGPQK